MHASHRQPLPDDQDEIRDFVMAVLQTGFMLTDLLGSLLDALGDQAFPGESPAEVLVAMLTGSIRPVADAAGPHAVRDATALLGAMGDRTIMDLRAAAELARRR